MTTVETLTAARKRVEDPAHWTRHCTARDANGAVCASTFDEATCWCAYGSLWATSSSNYPYASELLHSAAHQLGFRSGIDLNDKSDHATVLKMFDLAITEATA